MYTRGRASYRTSRETRRRKRTADNRKRLLQSERPHIPVSAGLCFRDRSGNFRRNRISRRNQRRASSSRCPGMKILIRATNWVGDAIMALLAIRAIRNRPDANISILARSYVADIYRDQNVADELIIYDHRGIHGGISGRERLASELRSRNFDVAILLQNAFDAAWLAWRAGIPQRIGYARDARSLLLTRVVPVPKPGEIPAHEKFYYLELLRRISWIDSIPDEPFINLHVNEAS